MYIVKVKAIGGYTTHSQHESYRDAMDQADMIHGTVESDTGMSDEACWRYAVSSQVFDGDFAAWQTQDDEERAEYELGARGIGTV